MPKNVRIDRDLEMRDERGANVRGPMMEEKRHRFDRFDGIALDTTNRWARTTDGSGDSIAISETVGGSVLLTHGSSDNDSCMLSSAIIYNDTKEAIVEFRITITNVTGSGVFVGFSDAKSETNGQIALQYPANTFTSTATNAVGFVIDADHTSSLVMAASVKAGSDTTPVSTGVTWTDGQTKTLRVLLKSDDSAIFILDGTIVASIASAIASGTLMCATVQVITRAAEGVDTIRVHSFDSWQDD